MTGEEAIELERRRSVENIIKNNPDKSYLIGFKCYIEKKLSSSTTAQYIRHIANFMDYCNNKKLEDIELDDYSIYLSLFNEDTPSYQITIYAALKKFSSYLYVTEKNMNNSMQHIERPKFKESVKTKQKRDISYLTEKEIDRYIETTNNGVGSNKAVKCQEQWKERDMLIVLIFLNTGIRRSALCKLDVDNIDLKNKQLITIDKGDKIQIHDLTSEMIPYIIAWLNKRKEILGDSNEKALFISRLKTRIGRQGVVDIITKYAINIENKKITPHKLRGTYGTQLYNNTGDILFVQERMGHKNPKTTELYIRGQKTKNQIKAASIMSKLTIK